MDSNDTFRLFSELATTVEALGIKETANILNNARSTSLTLEDKGVGFVLRMVCDGYGITIEDLMRRGRERKSGQRLNALKLCVYYLRKAFNLSFKEIGKLLGYDVSYVFKRHEEIYILAKEKTNKAINKKIEQFDLQITEYQLNNKIK